MLTVNRLRRYLSSFQNWSRLRSNGSTNGNLRGLLLVKIFSIMLLRHLMVPKTAASFTWLERSFYISLVCKRKGTFLGLWLLSCLFNAWWAGELKRFDVRYLRLIRVSITKSLQCQCRRSWSGTIPRIYHSQSCCHRLLGGRYSTTKPAPRCLLSFPLGQQLTQCPLSCWTSAETPHMQGELQRWWSSMSLM